MRLKRQIARSGQSGFSMVELMVVVAIIMIVAAVAVPNAVNAIRNIRLREAGVTYAGIIQRARLAAVRNNTYYPVVNGLDPNNLTIAWVDLNRDGAYQTGEPMSALGQDVVLRASGAAPNTNLLKTLFLPNPYGGSLVDLSAAPASGFLGNRGLPCQMVGAYCSATNAGAVGAAPVALWAFMQSTTSQQWEAVTVTPAGRVQTWFYNGATWNRV